MSCVGVDDNIVYVNNLRKVVRVVKVICSDGNVYVKKIVEKLLYYSRYF